MNPKDNIKKQLDMRSFATRIWLLCMVIGLSLGVIELVFNFNRVLLLVGMVIVFIGLITAIYEKRIDRHFQNKRRLE
jgi:disulfide bond formation protein DsbB